MLDWYISSPMQDDYFGFYMVVVHMQSRFNMLSYECVILNHKKILVIQFFNETKCLWLNKCNSS